LSGEGVLKNRRAAKRGGREDIRRKIGKHESENENVKATPWRAARLWRKARCGGAAGGGMAFGEECA